MKIYILGWYGKKNLGDDLMLAALIEKLILIYKKPKIFVQADKKWCKKNKIINYKLEGLPFFSLVSKFPLVRTIIFRLFYDWFIAKNKIDLIILGGGSTLKYHKVISNYHNIVLRCRTYNHNLKVIGCGVSIGPFLNNKSKKEFIKFNKVVDNWWVRDTRSNQLLNKLSITKNNFLGPDLAFLYFAKTKNLLLKKKNNKVKTIVVCLRSKVHENKQKKLLEELFNFLCLNKKKYQVIFLNFCTYHKTSDSFFSRNMISELSLKKNISIKVIDYKDNIIKIFKIFKKADIIFAVRYHAVICSLLFKKTPFVFSYDQKVDDLLKDRMINKYYLWKNLKFDNKLSLEKINYNNYKQYTNATNSLIKILNFKKVN